MNTFGSQGDASRMNAVLGSRSHLGSMEIAGQRNSRYRCVMYPTICRRDQFGILGTDKERISSNLSGLKFNKWRGLPNRT